MFTFSPAVEYKDVTSPGSSGGRGGPNITFVNFTSSATDYANLAKSGPTNA